MVFCPPPLLNANGVALVNGAKKTPLNVESSLNRIASAVRQASRRLMDGVPTCVTLFEVPMAGVSNGSPVRKPELSTAPRRVAAMVAASAAPHQFPLARKFKPPVASALVPLFLMTELVRVNCAVPSCRAPTPLNARSALAVFSVAPFCRVSPDGRLFNAENACTVGAQPSTVSPPPNLTNTFISTEAPALLCKVMPFQSPAAGVKPG